MKKIIILPVCLIVFTVSALSQDQVFQHERDNIRNLALELYANMYAQSSAAASPFQPVFDVVSKKNWQDEERLFNTLVYLLEQYDFGADTSNVAAAGLSKLAYLRKSMEWLLGEDPAPTYDSQAVAQQLVKVYRYLNPRQPDIASLFGDDPVDVATFFTIADRMDAQLDGNLNTQDLKGFYSLVVREKVPLSAIGYNCRVNQTWTDRRALIDPEGIEAQLPKKIRRLKRSALPIEAKVEKVVAFINQQLSPEKDGWSSDFWQTPFESKILGKGDCEDFALMFQSIAEYLDLPSQLVVGKIPLDGDERKMTNHAWNQVAGKTVDSIRYNKDTSGYVAKIIMTSHTSYFVIKNIQSKPQFKNKFMQR